MQNLFALGLIVFVVVVAIRLNRTENAKAENYLKSRRALRKLKQQNGIPLNQVDIAARRADGHD